MMTSEVGALRGDGSARPATILVRVKPGSSRDAVGGRYDGASGPALVIAVSAPAVDGRATEAARRALASALRVRRASVVLHSGATSRDKRFTVEDPPADLAERVSALRDAARAS
jgi:uncharacterized protein